MDYLDTSSSATSVCLSQTDGPSQPGFSMPSFNQQQLFKEAFPETEFQDTDMKNDALFGGNFESQFGIPLTADALLKNGIDCEKYENHFPENVVAAYSNKSKDGQQELSSSMISQSFGVQDMALNSIDSVISESAFLNRKTRAQAPSMQRKKTFTKVFKTGAVGRSIDITRYSGYDELKHELACMFNIEGQLEDQQGSGWKLVICESRSIMFQKIEKKDNNK
uniref:PB1 domain-containing protein n=1 Tax=Ananas comosus var. bracteatus TaxID=296719 RepID=A0A6V7P9X8_ANACO|nr:unnamed protein product [Ananas comosus var. bracteatus]